MLREIISFSVLIGLVNGHGYLWSPPGRGTARHRGYTAFPINYNHMANFCGGFQVQWEVNGGRCGVCGDRYDQKPPRSHEVGGPYGPVNRPVTGTYESGSVINVGLYVTAYHRGFFSFRLCVNNNFSVEVTQDCLNQNLLIVNGTDSPFYSINNHHKFGAGYYTIPLQLPAGVVATQAVLQWNYTTGNSWNGWPGGPRCTGCGPQETFINCADIAIVASVSTETTSTSASQSIPTSVISGLTSSSTASQATPTTSTIYPTSGTSKTYQTTSPSTAYQKTGSSMKYQTVESNSNSSSKLTVTTSEITKTFSITTTPSTTTDSTTTISTSTTTLQTKNISLFTFLTTFDSKATASSTTENSLIATASSTTTSNQIATSSSTLTSTLLVTSATTTQSCTNTCSDSRDACRCSASGAFAYYFGMSYWCWINCKGGYCPPSHCHCFCYS